MPSEYEKLRQEKVLRNEALIESLGLRGGIKEVQKSSATYKVLDIKDHREASKVMGGWELLVRLEGSVEDTWEPIKNLKKHDRSKVQEYTKAHHSVFNVAVVPLRRQPPRSSSREMGKQTTEEVAVESSAKAAAKSSTDSGVSEEGEGHDAAVVPLVRQPTRSRTRQTATKATKKTGGTEGKQTTEEVAVESSAKAAAKSSTDSGVSEEGEGRDAAVVPLVRQPTRTRTRPTARKTSKTPEGTEGKQSTDTIGDVKSSAKAAATSSTDSRESEDCKGRDAANSKEIVEAGINMEVDSATTESDSSSVSSSTTVLTSSAVKESKHCEEGEEVVTKAAEAGETEEKNEATETIDGKVDSSVQTTTEANKNTELHEGDKKTKGYNNSQDCHHDNCANYREETNAQYCRSGSKFYLADVRCALCHDMFTSTEKSKRGEYFKPSFSKPLYACINSVAGCRHAICYHCFQKKLLSSDN